MLFKSGIGFHAGSLNLGNGARRTGAPDQGSRTLPALATAMP